MSYPGGDVLSREAAETPLDRPAVSDLPADLTPGADVREGGFVTGTQTKDIDRVIGTTAVVMTVLGVWGAIGWTVEHGFWPMGAFGVLIALIGIGTFVGSQSNSNA